MLLVRPARLGREEERREDAATLVSALLAPGLPTPKGSHLAVAHVNHLDVALQLTIPPLELLPGRVHLRHLLCLVVPNDGTSSLIHYFYDKSDKSPEQSV